MVKCSHMRRKLNYLTITFVNILCLSFTLPVYANYWPKDRTPPSTPVVTDDGKFTSSATTLHCRWSSKDPETGIRQYGYAIGTAKGQSNVYDWRYTTSKEVTVTTGIRLRVGKTYYFSVKAQNNARMWSNIGYSDGICLMTDSVPPTGTVLINQGAPYANSSAVKLNLSAKDNSSGVGLGQMRFSNDGTNWSCWEAYATTKSWNLTSGNGTKTVSAQFKDKAGNISSPVSDSIILDTTPPTANAGTDRNTKVNTTLSFDGSGSSDNYGIASYTWNFGDGSSPVNGVSVNHQYAGPGTYIVTLSVIDLAGNGPATDSAQVTVNSAPNHPPVLEPIGNKFFYINMPEALAQAISSSTSSLQATAIAPKTTLTTTPDFSFNKLTKSPVTDEPSLPTTNELSLGAAEGSEAIFSLAFAPGWPITTGGAVFSSPTVGDLDGNGDLEIVIGSWDGKVYAFHHNGLPVTGWPVTPMPATSFTHIESSPVICDIDGDGDMEVIVGSGDSAIDSYLSVYNHGGTLLSGWPKQVIFAIRSSPAVGDIDGDGKKEIVVPSNGDKLYAFHLDGNQVSGWPIPVTNEAAFHSSPALGDIDGDRKLDIVIGSWSGKVYAFHGDGSPVPGWPKQTISQKIECSPAIGDIDGDGKMEVVIADSLNNWLYALRGDGTNVPGWPAEFPASEASAPTLGDIDGDGKIEIVIGGFDGKAYAFKTDGTLVSGWPVATGGRIESSPAMGDIDGDGDIEVVLSSYDGNAYAFHHDGTLVDGWPVLIGESPEGHTIQLRKSDGIGNLASSPALADLDGDGDLEVIIGSSDKNVYVIEQAGLPVNPFNKEWPKYRGRLKNTGFYPRKDLIFKVSATDVDGDTLTYSAFNLPPGAEFDSSTGAFKWIPLPGDMGDYPGVRFEASDGKDTVSQEITITLKEAP